LCGTAVVLAILLSFFGLWNVLMNPTIQYGNVEHDFSLISSKFDLKQSAIDHWCLRGDDDSCRCEDPLVPTSRGEFPTWTKAHRANKEMLSATAEKSKAEAASVQVAFVGESLVEEMSGRWMGQSRGPQLVKMANMFASKFSSAEHGVVKGVALGIAGDTSPNVLWRLLHGEMPSWFNPEIWWICLGMNDLGRMQCSEEVVVMGILRVVEEILEQKPNAQIVVNSMLPMADLRGGMYPHVGDYQEDGLGAAVVVAQDTKYVKLPQEEHENDRALRKRPLPVQEQQQQQQEEDDANNPETLDQKKTLQLYYYKRKDPTNPLLNPNQTKMKKYQVFRKNRLPLWTSIHAINVALKKFCDKQQDDRVTFFDATSIFASRVERGQYMLKSEYISVRGHPTMRGFEKWEDAMLEKLQEMLAKQDTKTKVEQKESGKTSPSISDDDQNVVAESSSSESSSQESDNER
jgi:lysophospholipase L1-like esterase